MTHSVLIADKMPENIISELKEYPSFEVNVRKKDTADEELNHWVEKANAVIVRSATQIDQSFIDRAKKLKVIIRAGIGVDNIDLEYATQKGLVVMNTPAQNANAAAELSLTHIFSLLRKVVFAHVSMSSGEWNRNAFVGEEFSRKTLGLIGFGNVGRLLAQKSMALGAKVVVYDPYLTEDNIASFSLKKVELDELFKTSDIISLHAPLTDSTKELIRSENISK